MSRYLHHLHAAAARRLRGLVPPLAAVLAHTRRVRRAPARVGQHPCPADAQEHRAVAREGYQGLDDV